MTSYFASPMHNPVWLHAARLAIASWAAVIAVGAQAHVASSRNERVAASAESRTAGEPIMAIVSLRNQRVTVYDANGPTLRAPVSSGQKGRETPAGIFSIIQKEAEHYSNLYDDAYMPHMQRITWSGIALHGGPLPGYPASHGCIRMPYDFATRLFGATKLGMRVIVAPSDVVPVEIAHPALFSPKPSAAAAAAAAALAGAAQEAASKAGQARLAAATASREAARAMMPVRAAESLKRKPEAELAAAERAVASPASDEAKQQAEDAKAKATAKLAELEEQVAAAKAKLQPKLDAAEDARETAAEAEKTRVAAVEAAREAQRSLEPVSVFISRKTQRLYVRQAFEPILESPITIQDADRPIGTHVFTAMERIGNGDMRWSVVSLVSGHPDRGASKPRGSTRGRGGEPISTDPVGAKAALDRITIPQDILDRLAGMASPRSSLIISDEALSPETGKGTDFVVLMSGEPQGGIKFRRRSSEAVAHYERPHDHPPSWRSPFAGPFSTW